MVDEKVLTIVKRYLRKLRRDGMPNLWGVLFGSQVTGKHHKWSDIDLIVIAPQFDDLKDHQSTNHLWWRAAEIDSRIEPIPCGEKQWLEDDSSMILEIARREGIVVKLPGDT